MYLDAFKSVLPIAQTQVIEAVLESMRQQDLIRSDIEYEKEWDRITKLISASYSAETSTQLPPEYQLRGEISHEFMNQLFMSLFFDMQGVYTQTNVIDNTIGRHTKNKGHDCQKKIGGSFFAVPHLFWRQDFAGSDRV